MKLIYIQNVRMPTEKAHGIHLMKMGEAFSKFEVGGSKFEVELVVPRRFNKIKEDAFDYYGVARIFKIRKLPCLDLIPLDKYIGYLGLWVESITFALFVFLYILFKKTDVIYTRDKFLLPLSFFKKNIIFEAHTFPQKYFLYHQFLKKIRGLVVITQKLKSLFLEKGIAPSKILVAPDGVDLEKFDIKETKEECRRELNLPQDKRVVLYTGHLYEWKGADVLLEAARQFSIGNYQFSNYLFIFVGGTKKDIIEFKKHAENLNNILIVGHRSYAEIPYWLRAADVLCLPNSGQEEISKYWTSPMKMFEYMAAKKPIVATDLPSIREILNEENAVLVESDSPKALTQGIKEVLQNSQLSDRISARAFEDVKEYTWQKRAEKICQKIF